MEGRRIVFYMGLSGVPDKHPAHLQAEVEDIWIPPHFNANYQPGEKRPDKGLIRWDFALARLKTVPGTFLPAGSAARIEGDGFDIASFPPPSSLEQAITGNDELRLSGYDSDRWYDMPTRTASFIPLVDRRLSEVRVDRNYEPPHPSVHRDAYLGPILVAHAASSEGSSGAPIWYRGRNGRPTVIGVHCREEHSGLAGSTLPRLVRCRLVTKELIESIRRSRNWL
jgi:hypothetical protein